MRPPPPLLALAAGLAQRAVSRGAASPSVPRNLGALAIAGAAVGLAGDAVRAFRGAGTTVEPMDPTRASVLVSTGVNSVTRNPMYVGLTGLLVAHAVRRGSWSALVPAAAFVAVIDRYQVAAEEQALHDLFGAEYDAYRRSVPRWLDGRSVSAAHRLLA